MAEYEGTVKRYINAIHLASSPACCPAACETENLLSLALFLNLELPTSRNTPSPIDPDSIQVPVGYEPDPADLALSSDPGQELFDPRKRKFSAEELKPQPMIKKARKIYIPEDCKVSLVSNQIFKIQDVYSGCAVK